MSDKSGLPIDQCLGCRGANPQRTREWFRHAATIVYYFASCRKGLTHRIIPGIERNSARIGFSSASKAGMISKVWSMEAIVRKSAFKLRKRPGHILRVIMHNFVRYGEWAYLPSSKSECHKSRVGDVLIQRSVVIEKSVWAELFGARIFDRVVQNMPWMIYLSIYFCWRGLYLPSILEHQDLWSAKASFER